MNTIAKILDGCERYETTGSCWTRLHGVRSDGYGGISYKSKPELVHRIIYEALVGPIPEGLMLHHVCRNRACCNPQHLDPMTLSEHTRLEDNVSSRNKLKTHCPKGHPLSGDNVSYIPPNKRMPTGGRYCRTCKREAINACYQRKKLREGRTGIDNADKTHCIHGHPFSPENTYIWADGKRQCKTCNRNRVREYKRRKRSEDNEQ